MCVVTNTDSGENQVPIRKACPIGVAVNIFKNLEQAGVITKDERIKETKFLGQHHNHLKKQNLTVADMTVISVSFPVPAPAPAA